MTSTTFAAILTREMETTGEIVHGSASHWGAIIATIVITIAFLCVGRKQNENRRRVLCRILAIIIAIIYIADTCWIMTAATHGSWEKNLPFHYCSFMLLVAIAALWSQNRTTCWVLYFGALTACLQGLLTPALETDFPHPRYFLFFAIHGILMPAALAVPLLLKIRARFRDIAISLLLMDAYLLLIHPLNLLLDTNYGFTRESPVPGCILDYLGPAPWYYLLLQIPVYGLFYLMYLPVKEDRPVCDSVLETN